MVVNSHTTCSREFTTEENFGQKAKKAIGWSFARGSLDNQRETMYITKVCALILATIITGGLQAECVEEKANACPFCDEVVIARQKVWETKKFYVLADYAPITHGHLLVVPKGKNIHVLTDLPDSNFREFGMITKKIKNVFSKMLNTDQYILLQKNGPYAGQTVNHLHFHFIPIQTTSNRILGQLKVIFKTFFWASPMSNEELQAVVAEYRKAFSD